MTNERTVYSLPRGAKVSLPQLFWLAIVSVPTKIYAGEPKENESDPVSFVTVLIFLAVIFFLIRKFIREMKEVFSSAKEGETAEASSGKRGSTNVPEIAKTASAPSIAAESEGDRVNRLDKFHYTSKNCANCSRWGGQREVVTAGLVGVKSNAYGKCLGGESNRLDMPCGAGFTCKTWALWPAADPMNA